MKPQYISQAPSRKHYADGRLPESERMGDRDWILKTLANSTTTEITPRSVVLQRQAAKQERMNDMFTAMKAVENVPVASRGRNGVDLSATEEYKALAGLPVTHKDDKNGWYAVECGSNDKAKKQQAMVNRYARAGAGTFRTRLLKDSGTLYVKRISEEYVQQRGAGDTEE